MPNQADPRIVAPKAEQEDNANLLADEYWLPREETFSAMDLLLSDQRAGEPKPSNTPAPKKPPAKDSYSAADLLRKAADFARRDNTPELQKCVDQASREDPNTTEARSIREDGELVERTPEVLSTQELEGFRKAALSPDGEKGRFIVDNRTLICHQPNCEHVKDIPPENQMKMNSLPYRGNFALCMSCFRDRSREDQLKTYLSTVKPGTKGEVIRKSMKAYCEKLGLYAEAKNGFVYITTISGEWFFSYNDRPIVLHHKNAEQWTGPDGKPLPNKYHIQDKKFYSPAHAIAYIAIHDKPERALAIGVQQLQYMRAAQERRRQEALRNLNIWNP